MTRLYSRRACGHVDASLQLTVTTYRELANRLDKLE